MPEFPGLDWYHTSIHVPSLEAASAQYSAALGVSFSEPVRSSQEVLTPNGRMRRITESVISLAPGHRLELGHAVEGPLPSHHLGFFADDIAARFAMLDQLGWVAEFWGEDATAPGQLGTFSYHRDPVTGSWIELIDSRIRPQIEQWMSGGALELKLTT